MKINHNLDFTRTSKDILDDSIQMGIQPLSDLVGKDIENIIRGAYNYLKEFNNNLANVLQDYENFINKNNFISKRMVDSEEILFVTASGLTQKSVKTKRIIQMLELGHKIILEIRFLFSGQIIKTEAILYVDGKFYKVGEEVLDNNKITTKVLSNYGASQNNPFSLAYQIDLISLKAYLEKEEIQALESTIWEKMLQLKSSYLEKYHSDMKKPYKVFYDSKDAEIYKLLENNSEAVGILSVEKYRELRQTLGGGGGYASPFYKMGDIGNVQVKFFNFNREKQIKVNYARMQLVQNQCLNLERILNPNQQSSKIKEGLIKFYTETEHNLTKKDPEAKALNQEFINMIQKIFT